LRRSRRLTAPGTAPDLLVDAGTHVLVCVHGGDALPGLAVRTPELMSIHPLVAELLHEVEGRLDVHPA
jgi:hypothetical protein